MKLRATFFLLTTLLLGFGLGFLTNGYFSRQNIYDVRKFATQNGFEDMLLQDLQLADSQKQKILPLVDSNYQLMQWYNEMHHKDMKTMQDSLYKSVLQLLNQEQQTQLKKEKERFEKRLLNIQQSIDHSDKRITNSPTNTPKPVPPPIAPTTIPLPPNPSNIEPLPHPPPPPPKREQPPLRHRPEPPPHHFPPPPPNHRPPLLNQDSLLQLPRAARDSLIRFRYERMQRHMRREGIDTSQLRPAQKQLYRWYEQYLSGDTTALPPRLHHKPLHH